MAKLKRLRQEKEVSTRGFSRWVQPVMKNYKLGCCDCGLVHEMEFKVFKVIKRKANGYVNLESVPASAFLVQFRARRAAAYTRRERRKIEMEKTVRKHAASLKRLADG